VATGSTSALNGGIAVAALTISGAVSIFNLRLRAPSLALWIGTCFLAAGVAVILAAVNAGLLWLFFAGTVIAGVGFGSSFLGALRLLLPLAHAHERAGLMSAFYVLSYLAFCVPALIAGFSSRTFGLVATTNVYGGAVIALALLALGLLLRRTMGHRAMAQG